MESTDEEKIMLIRDRIFDKLEEMNMTQKEFSNIGACHCENSEYGLSKRDGEELFFNYANETGASVYVYRFPNLVGKWVRSNYNSAVGTFCNNIANDLPITVNDPGVELEMLFYR